MLIILHSAKPTLYLIVIQALGCQWSVSLLLQHVLHFVIYAVISFLQGLQGVQGRPGIKVDETKIEIPLCFLQILFNKAMFFFALFQGEKGPDGPKGERVGNAYLYTY